MCRIKNLLASLKFQRNQYRIQYRKKYFAKFFLLKHFVYLLDLSQHQIAKGPRVGIKIHLYQRVQRNSSSNSSSSPYKSNVKKQWSWLIWYLRERVKINWEKVRCHHHTSSAVVIPFWCSFASLFCYNIGTLLCAIKWIITRWQCISTRWFAVIMWSVYLIKHDNCSPATSEDIPLLRFPRQPAQLLPTSWITWTCNSLWV